MENTATPVNPQVLKDEITRSLREIGIPPHLVGYSYIITGLELTFSYPNILRRMTTEFYPRVAMIHDTTQSRVERGIRHAIEVAYSRADPSFLWEVLGIPDINKGKLTNTEFFARMSENIQISLKSQGTSIRSDDEKRLQQLRDDLITLGVLIPNKIGRGVQEV